MNINNKCCMNVRQLVENEWKTLANIWNHVHSGNYFIRLRNILQLALFNPIEIPVVISRDDRETIQVILFALHIGKILVVSGRLCLGVFFKCIYLCG
ncbi:hypothetical protein GDO78_001756 [Eleutherodactylus coqui]|uniref:Uncharacterized protein n=1 Tax=Eleutherodactylus coqui TaxID=57060 RepID=A0A8J6FV66_ELECQ|nr:hypothetical protein GDO78_001756 [Eleutherodactylus coqui]